MARNSIGTGAKRRRGPGRPFPKGVSGNPGGRPKVPAEIVEAARALSVEALDTLAEIMRSKRSGARARIAAAVALLDRAWGRPSQAVEIEQKPIRMEVFQLDTPEKWRAHERLLRGEAPTADRAINAGGNGAP